MNTNTVDIHPQWTEHLQSELERNYMQSLFAFLSLEIANGKMIFPGEKNLFTALNATPLNSVRVVILGQDPYHGPGQAHGLSFSVMPGVKVPPSLRNIYKELELDLGCDIPDHGHLIEWAKQGVLLLNSVLSVEQASAASHQGRGWERFTDRVIEVVDSECENVVFMLWGAYAQKKGRSINQDKHLVLNGPHPSPLSAYHGFFGCGHFSSANEYLRKKLIPQIDWQIR
jgi:uracil-DNA glycosylase